MAENVNDERFDPLDQRGLCDAMSGSRFGRVVVVDRIGSTNTALYELGRAGEPEGLVIVAEEQTAGRGRLDRRWISPRAKSLLVSVLCRPSVAEERQGLLAAAAGLAAVEGCEATGVHGVGLKWPNDLVWEDRKLGGILIESGADLRSDPFYVVGMGMNVRWEPEDFPPEIRDTAASLLQVVVARGGSDDVPLRRAELLVRYLFALERWVGALEGDAQSLRRQYRSRLQTLGLRVNADTPAGLVEGLAVEVDDSGDLVVETDEGRRVKIVAGDVRELRMR